MLYEEFGDRSGDFFFVTLFSNSSNRNTKNTTVNFINTLASPLTLPKKEKWHVALCSLLCNNNFTELNDSINHIFVKTDIISQQFDGRGILSCHSRTKYDAKSNRIHFHEPTNLLFFPLTSELITDIEISLHSDNLKLLSLTTGQATSVVLKFQKMAEPYIPFWVNSKNSNYPNNSASNFDYELPSYFNNYGVNKFQVALSSITLTPNFTYFPEEYTKGCYFNFTEIANDETAKTLSGFINQL